MIWRIAYYIDFRKHKSSYNCIFCMKKMETGKYGIMLYKSWLHIGCVEPAFRKIQKDLERKEIKRELLLEKI